MTRKSSFTAFTLVGTLAGLSGAGLVQAATNLPLPQVYPPDTWSGRATAVVRVLDRLDSHTEELVIPVGTTGHYRTLDLSVSACLERPPTLPPGVAVHVRLQDGTGEPVEARNDASQPTGQPAGSQAADAETLGTGGNDVVPSNGAVQPAASPATRPAVAPVTSPFDGWLLSGLPSASVYANPLYSVEAVRCEGAETAPSPGSISAAMAAQAAESAKNQGQTGPAAPTNTSGPSGTTDSNATKTPDGPAGESTPSQSGEGGAANTGAAEASASNPSGGESSGQSETQKSGENPSPQESGAAATPPAAVHHREATTAAGAGNTGGENGSRMRDPDAAYVPPKPHSDSNNPAAGSAAMTAPPQPQGPHRRALSLLPTDQGAPAVPSESQAAPLPPPQPFASSTTRGDSSDMPAPASGPAHSHAPLRLAPPLSGPN
ncbi:DUF2155 domain-containing protein [Oecophyllibacter saccharovorans]|uniref:DUF2155 domain-containing protein n=1 Tax=Oecophyllibacter saccharovorans TaxID=2558360 RepID=UPI0011446869|nr:DUF2155 domain-containing protein [Oecophyllibacter saccharovorans]QDH15194.1 DUF2155 domain-containing protein [Oecophyllibacter saccharovorans]